MYKKILSLLLTLYKKPKAVALAGIMITVIFALAIPFIQFDNDIKNFLALDHPHRKANERLDSEFKSSEIIIIGVESDDAFSKETIDYIKWLQGEIDKLNYSFPKENIAHELQISPEEADLVINAINQNELQGIDFLQSLLTNPERMNSELFWDMEFSKKIAKKVKKSSISKLLQLYKLPVAEIKSVTNTDFIRGEKDKFIVEKLIDPEKLDDKSLADLKAKVKSWDLYDKLLYSGDDRLTALSVRMNSIDINLRQKFNIAVEKIITDNPKGNLKVYMAGEPVITDRVSSSMGDDLQRLLPFVLIVMLIILFVIFRHYEGVLFPMIAMIFSVIWAVGTMSILGIPMSMVSISVPTVLTAVASAYGIHFMTHYFMSDSSDRYGACSNSIKSSGLAIVMAALTTVVGFGSLVTSDMTHIKNYGIITAIGVFYSLVITITLIPAFLLLRKNTKPVLAFVEKEKSANDPSTRFLFFIERHLGNRPLVVVIISLSLLAFSLYSMSSVKLNMNTMDFFQEGSTVKVADERLNEMLAGTQQLNINIESLDGSEVITPDILQKVESFQSDIKAANPRVGKTVAVTDFLKKMNQEMHGGDKSYHKLPETTQMAKEYLLLYSGDLRDVITPNMDKLRIHISIKRGDISEQIKIRDFATKYFDRDFLEKNKVTIQPAGFMDLMIEANMLVLKGQISSLIMSLVIVAILMYIIFKDIMLTIISLIPLIIGIALNFGLMGLLNIPLNAATALVASISIGMGIDYSIHFITRFKDSLEELHSIDKAIRETYKSTGRAILSNSLSVGIGFMVLFFSKFPVIAQCGGLIAFTVTVTALAAIITIPAGLKILYHSRGEN